MIEIMEYSQSDTEEIIALVLHCQNDGTRPFVSVEDQPDLLRIKEEYIDGGGNFWVAKENGKVAGTIGLMNKGNGLCVLKKFFVYEPYRGMPHYLGQKLYSVFLEFAKSKAFSTIVLDTPKNTSRAHKFYEKSGFRKIEKLPVEYDYPYEDSDFFCLNLF
ncbi:MAG: GNAT family N-acetyltransferase [Prevotellaceae bacterium]|nr:GNAT family N-acetyltransferase [Prevotellaceae bacterium]